MAITKYEVEAKAGNADTSALAQKTLPALQHHLEAAETLQKTLGQADRAVIRRGGEPRRDARRAPPASRRCRHGARHRRRPLGASSAPRVWPGKRTGDVGSRGFDARQRSAVKIHLPQERIPAREVLWRDRQHCHCAPQSVGLSARP